MRECAWGWVRGEVGSREFLPKTEMCVCCMHAVTTHSQIFHTSHKLSTAMWSVSIINQKKKLTKVLIIGEKATSQFGLIQYFQIVTEKLYSAISSELEHLSHKTHGLVIHLHCCMRYSFNRQGAEELTCARLTFRTENLTYCHSLQQSE